MADLSTFHKLDVHAGKGIFLHVASDILLYGLLGLSTCDIEKFFKKVNDQAERIEQTFKSSQSVPRVTVSSIAI